MSEQSSQRDELRHELATAIRLLRYAVLAVLCGAGIGMLRHWFGWS